MSDAIVPAKKHWARAWVDEAFAGVTPASSSSPGSALARYAAGAGHTAGQYGLAGGLGMLLGASDAMFGPEPGGVSIDGSIASLLALISIAAADKAPGVAMYTRTIGAATALGYARRKTTVLMGGVATPHVKTSAGSSATVEDDPIVKMADKLK